MDKSIQWYTCRSPISHFIKRSYRVVSFVRVAIRHLGGRSTKVMGMVLNIPIRYNLSSTPPRRENRNRDTGCFNYNFRPSRSPQQVRYARCLQALVVTRAGQVDSAEQVAPVSHSISSTGVRRLCSPCPLTSRSPVVGYLRQNLTIPKMSF